MEICITRFDNKTFLENVTWKKKHGEIGCVYGTPIKISEKILPEMEIIVIEMNNSENVIEGLGIIKNKLQRENKKKYKIYDDNNYNRFIYKSVMRIDRSSFSRYEKTVIQELETMLFTTRRHSKRGQGIQSLPKFIKNKEFDYCKFLKDLYYSRFVKIDSSKIKIIE